MNRALSVAFGLLMVAATVVAADGHGLAVAGVSAVLVLVGIAVRAASTGAVLAAGAALVITDAAPMIAALCGFSATAYLVLRHTSDVTVPTVVGALGFTAVGLAAVAVPMRLPWVPLVAPLVVLVIVVLASRPFWMAGSRGGQRTTIAH